MSASQRLKEHYLYGKNNRGHVACLLCGGGLYPLVSVIGGSTVLHVHCSQDLPICIAFLISFAISLCFIKQTSERGDNIGMTNNPDMAVMILM